MGVEGLINQQLATLAESLCSILRIGTGLEMQVMNLGLRTLLYASGRQKVDDRRLLDCAQQHKKNCCQEQQPLINVAEESAVENMLVFFFIYFCDIVTFAQFLQRQNDF